MKGGTCSGVCLGGGGEVLDGLKQTNRTIFVDAAEKEHAAQLGDGFDLLAPFGFRDEDEVTEVPGVGSAAAVSLRTSRASPRGASVIGHLRTAGLEPFPRAMRNRSM